MAEGGEKTEEATPKKLRDAREKGQVCCSRDVSSTAVLLALFAAMSAMCPKMLSELREMVEDTQNLLVTADPMMAINEGFDMTMLVILKYSVIFCFTAAVTGVVANLAQIGFLFAFESLKPDLKKLNPVEGMKKIFSMKNLFEFAKNIVKVCFLGYLIYRMIERSVPLLLTLCYGEMENTLIPVMMDLFKSMAKSAAAGYIAIAAVDYFFQKKNFAKQMMMTKDEVKREYKEMEGNAEIKQKQKEIAQELLNGPDPAEGARRSTAVVTNPTHYAVGIRFVPEEMPLPQITCRGADYIAGIIRESAGAAGIPVIENVMLARALYRDTRVDDYIPENLLEPVVEVLKTVRDLENARKEEEEMADITLDDDPGAE